MATIAIIPARGGSKRIPRKNVREFCGKPMLARSIETVIASGLFDHVVVSTDDGEIAEMAKSCGADVPFVRPASLSGDDAVTDAVLVHAVLQCQTLFPDIAHGCCVYATTPFLTVHDLKLGLDTLMSNRATSVFPVVEYEFPIEQAFVLEGKRPVAKWPESLDSNSQEFQSHYHDAGMFYWFDVDGFLQVKKLFCENSAVLVIPRYRCQDLNTHEDWESAEIKFEVMQEKRML